jgi:hypothetical protein
MRNASLERVQEQVLTGTLELLEGILESGSLVTLASNVTGRNLTVRVFNKDELELKRGK